MARVFISSLARGEMAAIRDTARKAVESLGMQPVMFETSPASTEASRRALLDRVRECDALVLLLGAEYGEPGQRGQSPTEEEFEEARRRGIPVLALVQNTRHEAPQRDFISRVRGGWEVGSFAPNFNDASDVGFAVVAALSSWRSEPARAQHTDRARERALTLAQGNDRRGVVASGSKLRVVAVPILDGPLLDAVALRDATLSDDLATAARNSRLVSNDMAMKSTLTADAFLLVAKGSGFEELELLIGHDGAIVGEAPVGGGGNFGSSVVLADRAREAIGRTAAFALRAWERIDSRDEVRQVLVMAAVPEASYKAYVSTEPRNGMSMSMRVPPTLLAPSEPLSVRRADLAGDQTVDRLQAELQRAFELVGAVQ